MCSIKVFLFKNYIFLFYLRQYIYALRLKFAIQLIKYFKNKVFLFYSSENIYFLLVIVNVRIIKISTL